MHYSSTFNAHFDVEYHFKALKNQEKSILFLDPFPYVTPDDIFSTFWEESSQSYYNKNSASRNQSFPVSLGIDGQENSDDNYD